ncbi:winged helix-turn-helix domain-containing protein [Pseudoalteromonas sp. MMG005]|uniref:winged helix-turn-helix domain-containing protein n=2 Tax=unclassified Pseudoalteromonas TaxID=194690 RepID=UPI001B3A6E6E|nr:winged helix-turn-helix domain-containing protein [Pseudoalteromonas sp. MMG005]MBQ4845764.1 winged helix-turn-helix domain-containing protein [Pseudoalteromonas sp. MMG005]
MELQFSQYQYSCDKRVLYRNGELIVLKRNQTLLLEYFLLNPSDIHSKDDIMNAVWRNKVVSEQVVFQTISQLRAIFGEAAIKTYSKKGYKWQYAVSNPIDNSLNHPSVEYTKNKKSPYYLYTAISCSFIFLILLLASQWQTPAAQTPLYIATNAQGTDGQSKLLLTNTSVFADNAHFSIKTISLSDINQQHFLSPQQAWENAQLPLNNWLLWGDMYPSEKGVFLHYGLSNDTRHWQGYAFGETTEKARLALDEQLKQLHDLSFFSSHKPLSLAELETMHSHAPNNAQITLLLAKHLVYAKQPDVAMVHLDRLLTDRGYGKKAYRAQAQWLIGMIYKMRKQHQQSTHRLTLLRKELEHTSLWPLQYDYFNTSAWLHYEQGNTEQMFNVLEEAISLAQHQQAPLAQFELHMLYSILAKKVNNTAQQYAQLNKAQALLIAHNLSDSNKAIIYFHFALFTQDNALALPYLKRILTIPKTANNYWVLDNALEMLVSYYIEVRDFKSAHALFNDTVKQPAQLQLKAQVLLAQDLFDDARLLFQEAFNTARLTHNRLVSLNSALALYQLTHSIPELKSEYLAFLQTNASPLWLKQHGVTSAIALEH